MGKATVKSGTINLLNTIIGAGILAMPYGLKCNGIVFGVILIAWSAFTSSFGLYLQNKVAKYTHQTGAVSYFSLAQLTYPHFSILFDSAISIKCFGVGVSYLVVIGDLMPKIMDSVGVDTPILLHRNFWITIFMVVLVAPLSFLKKLDSLKYTSVIALVSIVYLACLVITHYVLGDVPVENLDIDYVGPKSIRQTLSSFPIFVFAYTCHQNMFAIINELKPSESAGSQTRQSNLIIRNAISTACFSYILVGVIGYLTFGNSVNANIITMYPNSVSSLIGRICIVIMVALSFPLQCHPCRGSVNHVIYFLTEGVNTKLRSQHQSQRSGYTSLASDIESVTSNQESLQNESFISTTPMEGAHDTDGHDPIIVKLTNKKFYIITACIVVGAYLVAISVQNLAHVLAIVGSTGSTSISFILPGLFGYLLIKPLDGATELNKLERGCKYGGLALAIWGVLVMGVCLTATLFFGASE
ncbi:vacuolar amino acid transporter 6 [Diutina catenulata]